MVAQKPKRNQGHNDMAISAGKPTVLEQPHDLLSVLRDLATDPDAPAMARTRAASVLLEAEGVLGKHSRDPHNRQAEKPLSECSLVELRAEHARLRQRFHAYFADK